MLFRGMLRCLFSTCTNYKFRVPVLLHKAIGIEFFSKIDDDDTMIVRAADKARDVHSHIEDQANFFNCQQGKPYVYTIERAHLV